MRGSTCGTWLVFEIRSWSSRIVDPHSLAEFFEVICPYNSLTRNYKEKKQIHAESQTICLQTTNYKFLRDYFYQKLPWLHRDCCVVHCWEPGLKDHTVMRPSPAPLTQKRPLLSKPKDLVKLHRIQLERNIPLRIKRVPWDLNPPDFIEEMARGIKKLRFIAAFIVFKCI